MRYRRASIPPDFYRPLQAACADLPWSTHWVCGIQLCCTKPTLGELSVLAARVLAAQFTNQQKSLRLAPSNSHSQAELPCQVLGKASHHCEPCKVPSGSQGMPQVVPQKRSHLQNTLSDLKGLFLMGCHLCHHPPCWQQGDTRGTNRVDKCGDLL